MEFVPAVATWRNTVHGNTQEEIPNSFPLTVAITLTLIMNPHPLKTNVDNQKKFHSV